MRFSKTDLPNKRLLYFEAKAEAKYTEKKDIIATKEDLANTKVDLIKWMVGFWIAQMAAIIGLYLHK